MARFPWTPSSTRTTTLDLAGGTNVIFAPPHPIQSGGDGTAMAGTFATANRAVGDTTLTLSAENSFNAAETWSALRVQVDRLRGSAFYHDSTRYEITAHTAAAAITFTPALLTAITAQQTLLLIQSDLPSHLSYLMLKTNGVNIRWFFGANTPSGANVMALLENGLSEVIVDESTSGIGCPAKPLHMIGAVGAGTIQTRIFAA